MPKGKYTYEEIVQACENYLSSNKSALEICQSLGLGKKKPADLFWRRISSYQVYGPDAFIPSVGNNLY